MNAVIWLFIGLFGLMILAFVWAFIKAWFMEICYQYKKRKAIKENSNDKWIYKI